MKKVIFFLLIFILASAISLSTYAADYNTQLDHCFSTLTNLAQKHWLDIGILLLLAAGIIKGLHQGFILGIFRIVGIILAIILAFHNFHKPIGEYLVAEFHWPDPLANATGFLGLFLVVVGICFLLGLILRIVAWILGLRWLDRVAGASLGLLKATLIVSFFLNAAELFARTIPTPIVERGVRNQINRSRLASSLVGVAPVLYQVVISSSPLEKKFASEKYFPEATAFARARIAEIAHQSLNKERLKIAVKGGITEQDLQEVKSIIQKNIAQVHFQDAREKLFRELERIDLTKILKQLSAEYDRKRR